MPDDEFSLSERAGLTVTLKPLNSPQTQDTEWDVGTQCSWQKPERENKEPVRKTDQEADKHEEKTLHTSTYASIYGEGINYSHVSLFNAADFHCASL